MRLSCPKHRDLPHGPSSLRTRKDAASKAAGASGNCIHFISIKALRTKMNVVSHRRKGIESRNSEGNSGGYLMRPVNPARLSAELNKT